MDIKAKRGDAVAWKSTVCYAGKVSGPTVYCELGEVVSVTRDGAAKKARKHRGAIHFDVDLRGVWERWIIPADKFDVRAMLDAYAAEAPHGFGGKDDDEAFGRLRAFVQKFMRKGTPS